MNPFETYMRIMRPFLTPGILLMERYARVMREVGRNKETQGRPNAVPQAQDAANTPLDKGSPHLARHDMRTEPEQDDKAADDKHAAAHERSMKAWKTRRANAALEKNRMAARRKARSNTQRTARRTARG